MKRNFWIIAAIAATFAPPTPAEAASTCRDVARHMESGSVLLSSEPVQLVPARRGRCLLVLSGWSIDRDDPDSPNIIGSGSVYIGDANVTADGTGGFVPPVASLELATEDEVVGGDPGGPPAASHYLDRVVRLAPKGGY